jgi:hypothetical protein
MGVSIGDEVQVKHVILYPYVREEVQHFLLCRQQLG